MAHSICASFSPALSTSRFTPSKFRFNARPVLCPVRPTQNQKLKLSLSPRRRSWSIVVNNSLFSLSTPVIKPHDHWATWTALFSFAAFGIWSEKTKWGSALSGALVSILIGLAASSAGLIPSDAPAYGVVLQYLLPVAVPLLLLGADLRRVIRSTGSLLLAFLLGSVATAIGTIVAYLLVPMRSLGQDSWKIAAALMSSYIGGTVNYVAVSDALGTSSSVVAAGVAADNVICALYFTLLFALASKILPESVSSPTDCQRDSNSSSGEKLVITHSAMALAIALTICKAGSGFSSLLGIQGGTLPCVTAIVVSLATLFPSQLGKIAPSAEAIALILMQVFFSVVGASGNISDAITKAPEIFLFTFVQVLVHLFITLGIGKLLGVDKKLLLIGSNANVGGPTTACAMATAKGWSSLVVPGVLAGIFGISIATFIGIGFGLFFLKNMYLRLS
ncbi:hypothetical protein LUZ62_059347 [Rhynchospora pubera]|uniref:Membrane protein YjcL n=1 Tax=Rhynchospora pubera TaxID=906938 RepID=A0AAV8E4D9_9POAL|nr:hypothetical protein LUZ62_059347 [Rhynchospora pubera]